MFSTQTHSKYVLSDEEEILIEKTGNYFKEKNPKNYTLILERLRLLRNLGNAVFDYPSVKDTKDLREFLAKEYHQLTEYLLAFSSTSHLLRVPVKVSALRSFLIAKFHFFDMLTKLTTGNSSLHSQAKNISFSVVFTLMAEAVYFSCLEDPLFSQKTKNKLAENLVSLWDSGIDKQSVHHLMAFESLWTARDSSPPSFGTMDGNTELLRISIDMDTDTEWEDFLKEESTNDKTRWALEEFLFGLSYEEMTKVRNRLKLFGVSSVSHNDVRSYLDSKPVYSIVNDQDPRAIYDFFVERKDACILRQRISASGPYHTLEEIYLKYRIILEAG